MISTLLRIARISLRRDRVAQIMTFVLPVAFFSIFAMVFGRASIESMPRIALGVVDEDCSLASGQLVAALKADSSLRVRDSARAGGVRAALDRTRAAELVRAGDFPAAVVIPSGWGAAFPGFGGTAVKVDVLRDVSDPVASQVVVGQLQRAAAHLLRGSAASEPMTLVATRVTDLLGDPKRSGRMISFYAAGIAVMFLLFSCASGGGALLDEQESGTLERVLSTNVGMGTLLAAKWIHLALLGALQILVMFVWGMLVFHLDLIGHLPGFAVMTVATAAAAAGFGLVLATACRTRQQLGGIATLVILVMSALGGSMFPRFLMSEGMQRIGLLTFNAWALDGYVKVFWREARLAELWPQLAVLAALTAAFLAIARLLARRWERA